MRASKKLFAWVFLALCIVLLALVLEGAWQLSGHAPAPPFVQARLNYALGMLALDIAARHAHVEIVDTDRGLLPSGRANAVDCPIATPEMYESAALEIAQFLVLYPPEVFEKAQVSKLVFCSSLRVSQRHAAGAADTFNKSILLLADPDDPPRHRLHHELFHAMDRVMIGWEAEDREWLRLNPRGFIYGRLPPDDGERLPGFVDEYAATSVLEDRASVFAWMASYPGRTKELAQHDSHLSAKAELLRLRLSAFHRSFDEEFWAKCSVSELRSPEADRRM